MSASWELSLPGDIVRQGEAVKSKKVYFLVQIEGNHLWMLNSRDQVGGNPGEAGARVAYAGIFPGHT